MGKWLCTHLFTSAEVFVEHNLTMIKYYQPNTNLLSKVINSWLEPIKKTKSKQTKQIDKRAMQRKSIIPRDSFHYSTFGCIIGSAFNASVYEKESINIHQPFILCKFHKHLIRKDSYHLRKSSDFFEERLDAILKSSRWYSESNCLQRNWESRWLVSRPH